MLGKIGRSSCRWVSDSYNVEAEIGERRSAGIDAIWVKIGQSAEVRVRFERVRPFSMCCSDVRYVDSVGRGKAWLMKGRQDEGQGHQCLANAHLLVSNGLSVIAR